MAKFKTTVTINIDQETYARWKASADQANEYLSRWCINACEEACHVKLPGPGDACPVHPGSVLREHNGWVWCSQDHGPLRSIGPHKSAEQTLAELKGDARGQ